MESFHTAILGLGYFIRHECIAAPRSNRLTSFFDFVTPFCKISHQRLYFSGACRVEKSKKRMHLENPFSTNQEEIINVYIYIYITDLPALELKEAKRKVKNQKCSDRNCRY